MTENLVPDADDVAREARLASARKSTARALKRAAADRAAAKVAKAEARAAKAKATKAARAVPALTESERDDAWTCALCRKSFASAALFNAHHVHQFLPIERCLDAMELTALGFRRTKAGLYTSGLLTEVTPSHVARLASVRAELEAFERAA